MRLIEKWQDKPWRSHAVYASLFWGSVGGLLLVWPALMTVIPIGWFVLGGVILSAALALAKILKRPGAE